MCALNETFICRRQVPFVRNGVPKNEPSALAIYDLVENTPICSGSWIGPSEKPNHYWVISAAHCLDGKEIENLEVMWGNMNLLQSKRASLTKAIKHPDYRNIVQRDESGENYIILIHDISLLLVKVPNGTPSFASLPTPLQPFSQLEGTWITVGGWGSTGTGSSGMPSIKYRAIDIEIQKCSSGLFATEGFQFCAGTKHHTVCPGMET